MASSPSLQSRYGHSSPSVVAKKRYGQFGETSPRTLIGLQKVNIQLQKDIEKLEKQAQTSVSNIANHQQAMKMSWRRLEHRRKMESPLLVHSQKDSGIPGTPKRHRTVLASNTKLYVDATPTIYSSDSDAAAEGEAHNGSEEAGDQETSSTPQLLSAGSPAPTHRHAMLNSPLHIRNSPYITSPYSIRRATPKLRDPSPLAAFQAPPTPREREMPRLKLEEIEEGKAPEERVRTKSASELQLPPITSPNQPTLVTHTTVTDKDTLLQASQLMGLGSNHRSGRFRDFYASDRPPSRAIRLKSPPPAAAASRSTNLVVKDSSASTLDSGKTGPGLESSSEPTLAELFEQIRHCRYIRHYRPDGTEVEDVP